MRTIYAYLLMATCLPYSMQALQRVVWHEDPKAKIQHDRFRTITTIIFDYSFANPRITETNVNDQRLIQGIPVLIFAAYKHDSVLVNLLIAVGAHLDIQDEEWGSTALIWTMMRYGGPHSGHIHDSPCNCDSVAKLLIKAGANLNIQDKKGYTALMHAVRSLDVPLVKLLIEAGADLNIQDKKGYTALRLTTRSIISHNPAYIDYAKFTIARLLIEAGSDLSIQDDVGRSALFYANREIFKFAQLVGPQNQLARLEKARAIIEKSFRRSSYNLCSIISIIADYAYRPLVLADLPFPEEVRFVPDRHQSPHW